MSSIYRRARPATFDQVIGQDHVKSVLTAAVARDAVGHAYLFSGPRGVGKTTSARLLAMAVNCDRPAEEAPCGECESCRMIRAGNHPDVTELDAASHNSVEDIRELREQVRLASLRGGVRVWILDEAHMLSRSAANALLKTLEEPPPNLVFVLATTEPEKLLPTILSRCQHFRFRRLTEAEIAGKLERLCTEAGVDAETAALELVARAADGAMRDAESMLERLLAAAEPIRRVDAEDALGLPPQERLEALATALATGDVGELMQVARALYRDGFAPRSLAEQLARTLRDALFHSVTGAEGFTLDLGREDLLRVLHALDDEHERFVRHDDLFALEAALVKAHNALFRNVPAEATAAAAIAAPNAAQAGQGNRPSPARSPESAAEPTAAHDRAGPTPARRTADLPAFDPHGRTKPPTGAPPAATTSSTNAPAASAPAASAPAAKAPAAKAPEAPAPDTATSGSDAATEPSDSGVATQSSQRAFSWHQVKARASAQLKAFLMPAEESVEGERVILRYGDTHRFHFQELKKRDDELASLVAEVAGPGYTIVVEGPGDPLRKKS